MVERARAGARVPRTEDVLRRARVGDAPAHRSRRRELAGCALALPPSGVGSSTSRRWDADSGLESLLRLRLRRIGIALASQVEIPGVGRVDFVLGDRLILEVDGGTATRAPSQRHKDLVRDAVAAAHGFDTLRFDYALVVHDWPLVEAAILAKVGARRAPRRPSRGTRRGDTPIGRPACRRDRPAIRGPRRARAARGQPQAARAARHPLEPIA